MYFDLDQLQKMADNRTHQSDVSRALPPRNDSLLSEGASREAMYLLLIKQTLEICEKQVPYYRDTWSAMGIAADDFQRLDDLSEFPPVLKQTVVDQKQAFLNIAEPRTLIRDTSGTTGKRLTVYGNDLEVAAQQALLKLRAGFSGNGEKRTGVLRVLPPMKRSVTLPGLTLGEETAQIVAFLTAYEKSRFDSYDNILDIIFQDYYLSDEPFPLSILHVTPPFIMDGLIEALERRGADMRRSPIRKVILTGNFVFGAQRKRIAELWDAETLTSFSCTEVIGEARECPLDRSVHHIGQTMYAEVVHPATMEPVPVGQQGTLLLTSLFPFQRVLPLIRYSTGDMARNLGYGCACGDLGLKIRLSGRTKHCVDVKTAHGDDLYFGTREVGEAIHDHLPLSQFPYPRFMALAKEEDGRQQITVHVESVHPSAFDAEGVTASIRQSLVDDSAELAELLESCDFGVEYHQRGSLSDHWKIYPER